MVLRVMLFITDNGCISLGSKNSHVKEINLVHARLPIALPQLPGRLEINRLIQIYQPVDRN